MLILSHRGYWKHSAEKNQIKAFEKSFSLGYGIETDIRDYKGSLVISHDMADANCISLEQLLKVYCSFDNQVLLALNIKSDGLQLKLKSLLNEFSIEKYFVFDMSIPDTLGYLCEKINIFTRESEFEHSPIFYDDAQGIWLDAFNNDWWNIEVIKKHLSNNKKVCVVSPELHGRQIDVVWHTLKNSLIFNNENLALCTDYPDKAKEFFYG